MLELLTYVVMFFSLFRYSSVVWKIVSVLYPAHRIGKIYVTALKVRRTETTDWFTNVQLKHTKNRLISTFNKNTCEVINVLLFCRKQQHNQRSLTMGCRPKPQDDT